MRRILGLSAVAVIVLAACGGKSGTSSGGSSPSSGGGAAALTVNTKTVSGVGTVLVDGRGFVLYHLKGETTSNVKCSGSCLSTWPPLLDTSGAKPTAGAGINGKLTTFSSPSGTQVAYNGMPLYTFTGDSGPGKATGQGVEDFFAVTPSMHATMGGGGGGRYGSSPSSGYGY
jgi:predicted lipoprotein with Yx(FWY)xxD motif